MYIKLCRYKLIDIEKLTATVAKPPSITFHGKYIYSHSID